VRQPIIPPITEIVTVDGEEMPISLEAFMIALGKTTELPGIGKNAFGDGMNFDRPEDYFLRFIANIALGDKTGDSVPDADAKEMKLFADARGHLPKSVFDIQKWQRAVRPEEWKKVVYVLNRGGRYEDASKTYSGDYLGHRFGKMFSLYPEPVATTKDSVTGEYFWGTPKDEPIRHSDGKLVTQDGYELHLITYKETFGGHSRTIGNYWTNVALQPENPVLINRISAQRLGLKTGDWVKLTSPSNPDGVIDLGNGTKIPVSGAVKVIEGIAPGVVAVSWHYGHWAYGGNDVVVDGEKIKGDRRRLKGLCPNPVMLLDGNLKNVCLTDPIGASASFYDTKVKLVKTQKPTFA
jgi:anaerobic selenocysteine-containing dehydrogenase